MKRILRNSWIEWDPHPTTGLRGPSEKQTEFLLSNVVELLYGGAVRGGKSFALLAASVMFIDVPGYGAIIFRKHRSDLELTDGLIDLAYRWGWDDKGAKFDGKRYRWTFPSGATVSFGYMGPRAAQGHKRYKSAWYQFIGFDQVEEIPEEQYLYMNSRLGRLVKDSWLPLRLWSTANPDGFEWVYNRFIKKETRAPSTRFIPATAADNPWVDLEALEERLSRLDPITYSQLRNGIWGLSSAGGMFDPTDFQIAKALPSGRALRGVRYWDLAATDEMEGGNPAYSCGVRMFRDLGSNEFYVDNVVRGRWSPIRVENAMTQVAALDRKFADDYGIRRFEIMIEQEPGSSGKAIIDHYVRNVLLGYPAFGDRVTGPKEERARPWAAAVARKFVYLVLGTEEGSATWIEPFRQEHRQFPQGEHKDQVDAAGGAFDRIAQQKSAPMGARLREP